MCTTGEGGRKGEREEEGGREGRGREGGKGEGGRDGEREVDKERGRGESDNDYFAAGTQLLRHWELFISHSSSAQQWYVQSDLDMRILGKEVSLFVLGREKKRNGGIAEWRNSGMAE